jgi:hypothetical protein
VLTGGHSHPADLSLPAVEAVLGEAGLTVSASEDPDAALAGLGDTGPDLLVVNTLRFTMSHPRYAEHRDRWALSLSGLARRTTTEWVERGGRLLALHTALVSFDDWPGWAEVIGGAWDWSRSSHPPVGEVSVHCDPNSPVTTGLEDFTIADEVYIGLGLRAGNQVVATASADGVDPQPASWVRPVGAGRVATSTLGHDLRSLDDPAHRALLGRLIDWMMDRDAGGAT